MFRMFGMSLQWLQVSAVAIDKNYKITDQSEISLTEWSRAEQSGAERSRAEQNTITTETETAI